MIEIYCHLPPCRRKGAVALLSPPLAKSRDLQTVAGYGDTCIMYLMLKISIILRRKVFSIAARVAYT